MHERMERNNSVVRHILRVEIGTKGKPFGHHPLLVLKIILPAACKVGVVYRMILCRVAFGFFVLTTQRAVDARRYAGSRQLSAFLLALSRSDRHGRALFLCAGLIVA